MFEFKQNAPQLCIHYTTHKEKSVISFLFGIGQTISHLISLHGYTNA